MAREKVPGMFKSKATFADSTKVPRPIPKEVQLKDTKIEDLGYDYTTPFYPGYMTGDPNLDRAELKHKAY